MTKAIHLVSPIHKAPANKTTDGDRIIDLLKEHGTLTTTQVGKHLGMTTDKAYRRMRPLMDSGKVKATRHTTKTSTGAEVSHLSFVLSGATTRWANERPEGMPSGRFVTRDRYEGKELLPYTGRPDANDHMQCGSVEGGVWKPYTPPGLMCVGAAGPVPLSNGQVRFSK
jgi:hypothetical protein